MRATAAAVIEVHMDLSTNFGWTGFWLPFVAFSNASGVCVILALTVSRTPANYYGCNPVASHHHSWAMSSGRPRCIRARLCLVNSFWFPCSACFCATFLITQNADYTWRHNYANINKYTIINECMVYVHIYMVYNCVFFVYLRSAHKSKCNTLEIKVDVSGLPKLRPSMRKYPTGANGNIH